MRKIRFSSMAGAVVTATLALGMGCVTTVNGGSEDPTADSAAPAATLHLPSNDASAAAPSTPNPNGKDVGGDCQKGDECKSGVCEGEGCGVTGGAKCAAADRPCTRDYREYCGCDGKIFHGSGSCPGRPYQSRDACK